MTVSADIYSNVGRGQVQPINPLAQLAQVEQIKRYQIDGQRADRAEQRQNALMQAMQSPEFQGGDTATRQRMAYQAGDVDAATKIGTAGATQARDQRDTQRIDLEMAIKGREAMSGGFMQLAQDPSQAPMLLKQMVDQRIMTPEYADKVLQGAQSAPDPRKFFSMGAQAAVSAKDQMAQQLQQQTQALTMRGQDMTAATAQRGQDLSNTNAQGNLAVAQQRLAADRDAPRGQVVQTETGTMLVDPRTGEARPVTAGGVPVQKPGRDIPAGVNKSIIENQQSIGKIDRAIEEITARPGALGLKNMIPGADTVRQYTDPAGIPARAGVADIGSLVLHDRSGAAVTISEFPRLRPFIPTPSDSPDAAKKKLAQLRKAYAEEADLLAQTYSRDQGYRESPALRPKPAGAAQAPSGASAPPSGAIAHLRANPGLRAAFEAKYGAGSAASALGQ